MRIVNGRVMGDLFGKFTCHKPTGSSVVDYVIASEKLIESFLYFKVSDFIPNFSDCHCKLSFSLLAKFSTPYDTQESANLSEFPNAFYWTPSQLVNFKMHYSILNAKNLLTNFWTVILKTCQIPIQHLSF